MLATGGALGVSAGAQASTTAVFNYSGQSSPQDVTLAGVNEYTYGYDDNTGIKGGSSFAPVGTAETGTYSDSQTAPSSDQYSNSSVKTYDTFLGAEYSGDSYLNLQFTADGTTYQGTATFTTTGGLPVDLAEAGLPAASSLEDPTATDVVLDSVTYNEVSAAPEPAAWVLLIAGAGLTGAMLRRSRHQLVAAA